MIKGEEVCVTGIGLISAIGINASENLANLRNSRCGIEKARYLQSKYADLYNFGEVKKSNTELREAINTENKDSLPRTDLLAQIAIDEAIRDSNLSTKELESRRTILISSSTVGGMCETDMLYHDARSKNEGSKFIGSYSGGAHLLKLVKKYNLKGYTNSINTACSSSANAIMIGTKLIKSGMADRAIVGGVDALAKFTVNGFNALQILSDIPCKPFDKNRKGLSLGEGAAYLVLEKSSDSQTKKQYAEVAGYGNSNDAYHPSSLSEDASGITIAMNKALETAEVSPDEIDYINTHGTATKNNDHLELLGILKVFNRFPPFNSTKSYTGHTLAAAGALECIFSIFSMNYSEMYKSLNVSDPIEPYNVMPQQKYEQNREIKTLITSSFGFSGNCTSLILKKCL